MKNKLIKTIYNLITTLLFLTTIQSTIFGSPHILNTRFGAQGVAMGGAFTALAYGPDAIFYNWASITSSHSTEIKIHQTTLQDSPLLGFSIQNPFKTQWIKIGGLYTGTVDIPYTELNSFGQPTHLNSMFSQELFTLFGSINKTVLKTTIGLRLGLFYEKIEQETASGYLIDLAIKKQLTIFSQQFSSALTIKNPFQTTINWSTGYTETPNIIINAGIGTSFLDDVLLIELDAEKEANRPMRLFAGIEYWLYGNAQSTPAFAVRAGLKNNDKTMGIGLKTGQWVIDYSYNHNNLIQTISSSISDPEHRFSIGLNLGPINKTISKSALNTSSFYSNKTSDFFTKSINIESKTDLIPKVDIARPIQTHLLSDIVCNVSPKNITLKSRQHAFDYPIKINQTILLNDHSPITTTAPLTIIQKISNSLENIMITIEYNDNKVIINGFIPANIDLFINNQLMISDSSNNSFTTNLQTSSDEETTIEIIIIEKF